MRALQARIVFVLVILPAVLGIVPPANALVCGDSEPDAGEECDDGNTVSGDGCSATCTIEPGFFCTPPVAGQATQDILADGSFEDNNPAWTLVGSAFPPRCSPALCGAPAATDGEFYLWLGGGFVDNGNDATATQTVEIPAGPAELSWEWGMDSNANPPGTCESPGGDLLEVLVDGVQVYRSPDPCVRTFPFVTDSVDLAALGYNDGTYLVEFHGVNSETNPATVTNVFLDNARLDVALVPPIPPVPSVCAPTICGDSMLGGTEQCDDGNTVPGDGCSASCQVEQPDFVCSDPQPPADSGENITDGSLEKQFPPAEWTQTGTVFEPLCSQALCGFAGAEDGAFFAWFGGALVPNEQTLTQQVAIAASATEMTFSLLVNYCDSEEDYLAVEIDGNELYRYTCLLDPPIASYTTQSVPLGAFADGSTHTVQLISNTEAKNSLNSNFFVDNISTKDNVPFAGAPSACAELKTACTVPEQFEAGIPAGWTVINTGADSADGWGLSNDGICGSQNWSAGTAENNVTGGGGLAACADSDATGQIAIDGGGAPNEMDTYLCTPIINPSQVTDPEMSFLVNHQKPDNANGNQFLQVLVGDVAPDPFSVLTYTNVGTILDHLDSTLALSEERPFTVSLAAQSDLSAAHVCFHYRGTYAWFAQIDNIALRGSSCEAPSDTDSDGVADSIDNCTNIANPLQIDSDGDNIGNICDADLSGDCIVNFADLGQMKQVFFSGDPDADFNSDGTVNFTDLGILKQAFFQPPGPSAAGCDSNL